MNGRYCRISNNSECRYGYQRYVCTIAQSLGERCAYTQTGVRARTFREDNAIQFQSAPYSFGL